MKDKIVQEQKSSFYRDAFKRFRKHKLAMAGCAVIVAELLVFFLLPLVTELDPIAIDKTVQIYSGPSGAHLLGVDNLGRDNFARFIYGGRVSLTIGLLSAMVSFLIGVPLGMIAGYYRGVAEMVIMRLCEIFMAFPSMVILLVLAAVFGSSLPLLTVIIGFLGWPAFCRLMYANVLTYKEKDYVEAARAVGTKNGPIMLRYIFPNAFSPLLIAFTFRCASAILTESSLSYLGLGIKAPNASWGSILNICQSITVMSRMPWMWLVPGITLVVTVLSINFFGDGLRDAFDPRTKI